MDRIQRMQRPVTVRRLDDRHRLLAERPIGARLALAVRRGAEQLVQDVVPQGSPPGAER